MRKNLVFLHLESISNTILWQYRPELATVWQLMQQSYRYTRYFSSSVSTDTVLDEMLFGASDAYDGAPLYSQRHDLSNPALRNNMKMNNIASFAYMAGFGYFNFIEYPWCNGIESPTHLYHPDLNYVVARMKEKMRDYDAKGIPFVVHFRVCVSHMAYDDPVKIQAKTFSERFRLGYLRQDQAVNMALSSLIELGLLEKSVLVCYGDHGDELWSHGLNKGYCHATIPYASLCNVPLFIYEHGCPPGESDRLVSTIDIRESLIRRIVPDYDPAEISLGNPLKNRIGWSIPAPPGWPDSGCLPPFRQTPFDGIDAFNETRDLAFTQNLFALQLEYSDLEQGLTKGYSVTDGTYRVVVSSGGRNSKSGGIEFFCDRLDPFNSRNLLDFFKLDMNGDIREFYPPPETSVREFSLVFNEEAVKHLSQTYNYLRAALHEFIRSKEERAKRLIGNRKYHVMPESVFRYSRKRKLQDA
jgi:hypothetical protein